MSDSKTSDTAVETPVVDTAVNETDAAGPGTKRTVPTNITQLLVSYGTKQSYGKGQFIIREGLHDKTVYIILNGEVEILKKDMDGKEQVINTLSDGGTILGEMSIFLNEPRSTSVRISKDTQALVFSGENFFQAVVNTPELSMRILKSLSGRVKATNEQLIKNTVCSACGTKMGKSKA